MKDITFPYIFMATLVLGIISALMMDPNSPPLITRGSLFPVEAPTKIATNPGGPLGEFLSALQDEKSQTVTLEPTYISPGGEERIRILLTIANGVVSEAEAISLAKHPTSQQMQAGFVEEFSGSVVGKSLAELENIDRIGGASLTTGAFRQALTELNQS